MRPLHACLLLTVLLSAAAAPTPAAVHRVRTMGTSAQVHIVHEDSLATVVPAGAAIRALQRVDSLMSNWTETSEVARINREAAQREVAVQPEVARVLSAALRIGRESGGAFDITVEPLVRAWGFLGGPKRVPAAAEVDSARARMGPGQLIADASGRRIRFAREGVRIDLGGIAKGRAVDCAADSLLARGVTRALVDVSGNMRAMGAPAGATHWRIGVRDPRDRMPSLGRLAMSDEAIATSGRYEQFVAQDGRTYGHILDPRTGQPAEGLIAVTVVAATAMEADAWGTALFAMGPAEARRMAAARPDLGVILVEPGMDGLDTLWIESSLRDRFTLDPAAASSVRVRYF